MQPSVNGGAAMVESSMSFVKEKLRLRRILSQKILACMIFGCSLWVVCQKEAAAEPNKGFIVKNSKPWYFISSEYRAVENWGHFSIFSFFVFEPIYFPEGFQVDPIEFQMDIVNEIVNDSVFVCNNVKQNIIIQMLDEDPKVNQDNILFIVHILNPDDTSQTRGSVEILFSVVDQKCVELSQLLEDPVRINLDVVTFK